MRQLKELGHFWIRDFPPKMLESASGLALFLQRRRQLLAESAPAQKNRGDIPLV
ncbi:hypothetical protein ACFONL_11010 [Camelimonas fluminis]|uniref:Uncharacterized protein n=1 Tax=Camelimonas fluminis TaxID=1576911 RepID=A0ABV7UHR7_9HYPH|nr:hypothetical protein [Camelimonas fluminis]